MSSPDTNIIGEGDANQGSGGNIVAAAGGTSSGSKKEKLLSLGTYPEVTLVEAREKRDEACKLLRDGIDPSANGNALRASRADSAANTLKAIAEEWLAKFEGTWAPSHTRGVKGRLQNDAYPWIGSRPIAEITPPEVLAVLRRIESGGHLESAHRVRIHLSMVFRFAIATGRAERDPTADLRGALPAARLPTRRKPTKKCPDF